MRLFVFRLLGILCFSFAISAQQSEVPKLPQPIRPGAGKQQEEHADKNKKRPGDQLASTELDKTEPKHDHPGNSNEEAENNRRLADYTGQLATYTRALVVVGILQVIALVVQAYFFNRSITEMKDATKATREAVSAYREYGVIAEASNTLTRESIEEGRRSNAANEALMKDSNGLTVEATRLTRQSLLLTQRPKVIVRNVGVFGNSPEADLFQVPSAGPGFPIRGSIFLVNAGNTKSRIVRVSCEILRAFRPMIPPYVTSTGTAVDIELAPGSGTEWRFETVPPEVTFSEYASLRELSTPVFALGRVAYEDELGTTRTTGFCRKWDVGTKRFRELTPPDPDYEHAD